MWGQSTEHSISRMSCTSVLKNLHKERYVLTLVGIDRDGQWYLLDDTQEDLSLDSWLDNAQEITDIYNLLKKQDVIFLCFMVNMVKMEQFKDYLNSLMFLMWDVELSLLV